MMQRIPDDSATKSVNAVHPAVLYASPGALSEDQELTRRLRSAEIDEASLVRHLRHVQDRRGLQLLRNLRRVIASLTKQLKSGKSPS